MIGTRFISKFLVFVTLCAISLVDVNAQTTAKSPTIAKKYNPDLGYTGGAWQEYEEFQSVSGSGSGYDDCFSSGKTFSDTQAFLNVNIPKNIGKDVADTGANNVVGDVDVAALARAVTYSVMAYFVGPLALIAVGIEYAVMVDVCSNAYVFSAAERVTLGLYKPGDEKKLDKKKNICVDQSADTPKIPKLEFTANNRVWTSNEIPYFFHCDPEYDPSTNPPSTTSDPKKIGRTYGYAGSASGYCNQGLKEDEIDAMKESLGTVAVGYWPKISRGFWSVFGVDTACDLSSHGVDFLKPGERKKIATTVDFYAFYHQLPQTGKIRLCVATPYTMFPIIVGCSTISPPGDFANDDPFISEYVRDTRCAYLLKPRWDLNSLGETPVDPKTINHSVNKFLRSDLHLTSTVIGCVKDMLMKIFMGSVSGKNVNVGPKPFFQKIQERMKTMVLGVLTLYVALLGIKIMTAGQPPSRGEFVMYAVKFALVSYFALGTAFYEAKNGVVTGIYPSILAVTEELSSIFLEAQNTNDPTSACRLSLDNKNILANRDIPVNRISYGIATEGYPGIIKTTVWDLVDCKVVNYLSFGTCNYKLSGLMTAWLFSGLIFTDFALAICCLIYSIMVMITVFKFAHIFILSMFTITILVFLSPIFLCFALFEPTKAMFQKWMQMILGYMLYPALLFAFVAIMFATFDAVMYGTLDFANAQKNFQANPANKPADFSLYKEACKTAKDSMFCKMSEKMNYEDPCTGDQVNLSSGQIEHEKILGIGYLKKVNSEFASDIRSAMMKLLLFALLFFLFLGSVTEFMAVLVGVQSLGDVSKGLGTPLKPLSMAASSALKSAASGAANKVAQKAGSAMTSRGSGGSGGSSGSGSGSGSGGGGAGGGGS